MFNASYHRNQLHESSIGLSCEVDGFFDALIKIGNLFYIVSFLDNGYCCNACQYQNLYEATEAYGEVIHPKMHNTQDWKEYVEHVRFQREYDEMLNSRKVVTDPMWIVNGF